MSKKITTITIITISILLISLYVISNTYSVIIDVIDKNNTTEIINDITIKDIFTDDLGNYNNIYYQVLNELDITSKEADILIESIPLNKSLQIVLNNIVDYKLHNGTRLTNEEIYNLILTSVKEDDSINPELKDKIIIKSKKYIYDVSDYLYDIKVNNNGVIL